MNNYFFEQQKKCPVCHSSFSVTRLRSSACFVLKKDSDFFVKYKTVNPLHYAVWVCPKCHFAATASFFNVPLTPKEIERLKTVLLRIKSPEPDFSGRRTPELALRSYELAINTAQIRMLGAGAIAGLYLRAAWICREIGNKELEGKYLDQARLLYIESYEREQINNNKLSDCTLLYLIGELHRRLGLFKEAIQWFNRVVSHKDIKKEPEIERMTRAQWEAAKLAMQNIDFNSPISQQPSLEYEKDIWLPDANAKIKTSSTHRRITEYISHLYLEQVQWLEEVNKYRNPIDSLMDINTILRAIIDVIMELNLEWKEYASEEELKIQILKQIKDSSSHEGI